MSSRESKRQLLFLFSCLNRQILASVTWFANLIGTNWKMAICDCSMSCNIGKNYPTRRRIKLSVSLRNFCESLRLRDRVSRRGLIFVLVITMMQRRLVSTALNTKIARYVRLHLGTHRVTITTFVFQLKDKVAVLKSQIVSHKIVGRCCSRNRRIPIGATSGHT